MDYEKTLAIKIDDDYTLRECFIELLKTLWLEGEDFSGKRPFGASNWQWNVYRALAKNKLIKNVKYDEDGDLDEVDYQEADQLIMAILDNGFK